jgi:hypothetical protein
MTSLDDTPSEPDQVEVVNTITSRLLVARGYGRPKGWWRVARRPPKGRREGRTGDSGRPSLA